MRDKDELPTDGVNAIEHLFRNDYVPVSSWGGYERNQNPNRSVSIPKTVKYCALGAAAMLLVAGGIGAVSYGVGVENALSFHAESKGSIVNGGKAVIEKVSMEMPPITLATADTKVTGVKVAFEEDVKGLGLSIPVDQQTLTRAATVETDITIDPGTVQIAFDSAKDKLTFFAPDAALSTKVDIPAGESSTTDTSGSITTLPLAVNTAIANSIAGMFGTNASQVPLLGGVAKGTTSVTSALEQFADLDIVTQVDQQCTPLIPTKVKDFTGQLENNIKTAVQGELLDSSAANSTTNKGLSALMDLPLTKVQKIVEDATVEMPTNYKIGPDQTNITSLNNYLKTKFFSTDTQKASSMTCGVSKSAKLSLVNPKGKN